MKRFALWTAIAVLLAGCSGAPGPAPTTAPDEAPSASEGASDPRPAIRLTPFLDGFSSPLLLTHDGTPGVVYVVEQAGRVLRVEGGVREVWLDVRADVASGGERGLLGLAFLDGRAYIDYTDANGDSVLQRVVDGTRETLLRVDQPYGNHNGGHLAVGPDGHLYWGLGDGGSAGDPRGHAQDPHALLGSILRLDVSGETGYAAPHDNPYASGAQRDCAALASSPSDCGGGAPEVWAKGLRNPWRFSFDRATGDLYIGDVGQNQIEEINHLPAGTGAGSNFGWSAYEGSERFNPLVTPFSETTPPIAQYTHADGCSVTGGHTYRGEQWPTLEGTYLFADYCSGKLWTLRHDGTTWQMRLEPETGLRISSFGEDSNGELYILDHAGAIYSIGTE